MGSPGNLWVFWDHLSYSRSQGVLTLILEIPARKTQQKHASVAYNALCVEADDISELF